MTAALIAMSAAGAGCFYTDPINHRPVAVIVRELATGAPTVVHRGDVLVLSAGTSLDADGDALTYAWSLAWCTSDDVCEPAGSSTEEKVSILLDRKQVLRVGLTVRDGRNAEHAVETAFAVDNRPPVLELENLDAGDVNGTGCFTAGRRLTFFATVSDPDGDPLELAWLPPEVAPASNPNVLEKGVVPLEPRAFAVRPDVEGVGWMVKARVSDGTVEVTETLPFCTDPDQPPCLETTDPAVVPGARVIVARDGGVKRFAVETVRDDLDPYPFPQGTTDEALGVAGFRWSLGPAGAPPPLVPGAVSPDFLFDPSIWSPGDLVGLRVETTDRVVRPTCSAELGTCEARPGCPQRLTWTVEVR